MLNGLTLVNNYFRYNLPIIIVVVNNNGIYSGLDPETWEMIRDGGDPTLT